jgi:release factor glutamine methyltransferase
VPNASAIATDISAAALAVALQNAQRQGVADRLALVEASVLDGVSGPLDLVVSNPPYIPDAQIEALDPEVRDHEPRLALSGGDDGLAVIMQVIAGSRSLLRSGGSLLMEIGFDQSEQVRGLLTTDDWAGVAFLHDLQGIPRIVKAIRN